MVILSSINKRFIFAPLHGIVEYWVSGLTKPFYENGRIPLIP